MKKPIKIKKKKNWIEISFILFCVALPVISWLMFYVYTNLSSFFMAFTNVDNSFTLEHFGRLIEEFQSETSTIRIALKNTLLTFGILVVTYPLKVLVSFFIYKKVPFSGLYRILFFLPSIIFGVAIAMIFNRMVSPYGFIAEAVQKLFHLDYVPELLSDSRYANITVLLHMVWLGFPGDLIIWGGTFARIPEEMLEAGKIDGVSWWGEFTKIVVPMVWPTVSLQIVMMACGIFGATGSVFLLTGGEYGTMTLNCWTYLQVLNVAGSSDTSNAFHYLSAVGFVMTVIAIVISLFVRKVADSYFDEVEF